VGTSIGSVNAAFLAIKGFSKESLELMTEAWHEVGELDLLPANYFLLTMRAMFGRSVNDPSQRMRDFFISQGVTPELTFAEIQGPRLVIVSADLNTGQPVLHGMSPQDKVLDALLVSTALPPWVMPIRREGRLEMDGGVVSNLPVEPALRAGATAIVALDLMDTRPPGGTNSRVTGFIAQLSAAVEKRQADLELELAAARGIPILHIQLMAEEPLPFWDFHHTDDLIAQGYEKGCQAIDAHPEFKAGLEKKSWLDFFRK
jgi:NTE family protein